MTRLALDLDGTLADSMGALEDLAVTIVQDAWPTAHEGALRTWYRRTAGMSFEQQLAHLPLLVPRQRHLAADEFAERKVAVTLAAAPFEDVEPALRTWRQSRVELVIVSSTASDLCRLWLGRWELQSYVGQVYGLSYGSKLEQLQRCRPRAFVGDTRWDAVKAADAGVKFLGVQRDPELLPEDQAASRSLLELASFGAVDQFVQSFLVEHGLGGVRLVDP